MHTESIQINFMHAIVLPSVSEVRGEPGSGRTSFCIAMCNGVPSLWIERYSRLPVQRIFSTDIDADRMYIVQVKSRVKLLYALENRQIAAFIAKHKIEIVVVNKIEDYKKDDRRYGAFQERLLCALKMAYLHMRVKTLIISDTENSRAIEEGIAYASHHMWSSCIPAIYSVRRVCTDKSEVCIEKPACKNKSVCIVDLHTLCTETKDAEKDREDDRDTEDRQDDRESKEEDRSVYTIIHPTKDCTI